MPDFKSCLESYQKTVNDALESYLPLSDKISESMRYSVLAGGKRIRPVITLAFCELYGTDSKKAVSLACALELIHTYSLIYDDMPFMDNDVLRRGIPTNHVVYGEAVSSLAGLALISRAFEIIAEDRQLSDRQKVLAVDVLAKASGTDGIITGQFHDLNNRSGLSEEQVSFIHNYKTGAMLRASAKMGCIAAGTDDSSAVLYADRLGLAFQIKDDILDVVSDALVLGKSVGKDKIEDKTTFTDILGIEGAQKRVNDLTDEAKSAISELPGSDFLCALADYLCIRDH